MEFTHFDFQSRYFVQSTPVAANFLVGVYLCRLNAYDLMHYFTIQQRTSHTSVARLASTFVRRVAEISTNIESID